MPTVPGQMFANSLNPAKGWPSPVALDFRAKASPNVLYNMVAGQACHLNASGQLEPGVVNRQMGLFIFQGVNELDVNNQQSPGQWVPINPSGNIMCLVAKGPYELETTEFDATQTYSYNQPLRAPSGNAAGAYPGSGQLTNQGVTLACDTNTPVSAATAACGLVSRGTFRNSYGIPALAYWPVWYPGRSSET
jgi:hypothetical protein